MKSDNYTVDEPIAALATPWGESAIAVIRTSGKGIFPLLDKIFRGKTRINAATPYSVVYGRIIAPSSDKNDEGIIDEVLVSVFRAPHSYTGEDSAEISCHGGIPIIRKILEILFSIGFRPAKPGEFTFRAFLNGKLDLTRAEAVNELIRAKTDTARELALHRLEGAIEKRIDGIKRHLVDVLSAIEVRLDYPEEELEEEDEIFIDFGKLGELKNSLRDLIGSFEVGKIYQEGVSVVLAGRTNAGKSTLFNLLLREERAIVSEVHGTTRDYIEGSISISDIPVKLFDTAGLRESLDPVEAEGIKRTTRVIENADLVLYVVDAVDGVTDEDRERLREFSSRKTSERIIGVWNKVDIARKKVPSGFVAISAVTGEGLSDLIDRMKECILKADSLGFSVKSGAPVIDSIRQRELLESSLESIERFEVGIRENDPLDVVAVYLQEAVSALGEITGEVTSADILNNIFSKFCVGK